MKFTVTLNKVEENMLSTLQNEEGAHGTLEDYAEMFFHNHLWIVYDMYYKEQKEKEQEDERERLFNNKRSC